MRSKRIRGFLLGLLVVVSLSWAEDAPVCLLTGFQPFGEAKDNPSWEMLKPLAGQTLAGYRIETVELPVVYDEMAKPLAEAIARHRPRVVICFGQGRGLIEVERVARNGYHAAKPPDNNGKGPPRERIVPDGPDELPTQLPVEALLAAFEKAGLAATASDNAGGYLCNECFYRLMAAKTEPGTPAPVARGFVHVPRVGEPNGTRGAFSLADLTKAARIAVETTIAELKQRHP